MDGSRSQLKCDGTRAETRISLPAKRTNPFKSSGASVQSTTGSRVLRINGSNAAHTMFRVSVKGTGYALQSVDFPSLPHPCATLCHHISTEVYCAPSTKLILSDSICPHRLMLGMYCREGIHLFFVTKVNVACPFWSKPWSDCALPAAAI